MRAARARGGVMIAAPFRGGAAGAALALLALLALAGCGVKGDPVAPSEAARSERPGP